MAKTKTTTSKTASARAARKTGKAGKKTSSSGGGGSNDPDSNESDDNDDLFPSDGGDDDGGGDDSDDESFYDYNYMGRADMVTLFETLGFSEAAAKQAVRYEQIDDMEAMAELTDDRCSNIVKNIRKVRARGSKTRFLTVSDAALNRFQMAVYATKHARWTNRTIEAHEVDTSDFDNLRAQREIEDKARETKPTLPAGLTLENDLRVAKTFESVVEHLGRYRGMTGVPLSYVVRNELHPPDGAYDPPVGDQDSQYRSYDEEMVARAPICHPGAVGCPDTGIHLTATFMNDMTRVWEILHDLFGKQTAWTHVSALARARNG